MTFRYLAIEGPPGTGKSALTEHIGARLDASVVLDEVDNPFLGDAWAGRAGAAFQAQLFTLLGRHRQQGLMRQGDLFSQATVSDYLFDRDRIYAYVTLDDNELYIYQKLFDLLVRDVVAPDLVVYLQAPADIVQRRVRHLSKTQPERPVPDAPVLRQITDAYNHFFFHYTATPLLVVETSHVDPTWPDDAVDEILRQVEQMGGGTLFYVPRLGR